MKVELTEDELLQYLTWKKEKETAATSIKPFEPIEKPLSKEELIERLKMVPTRVQAIKNSNMYVFECKGYTATLTIRSTF